MTTIAFRDGVLCADSLCTSNGMRDGTAQKVHKIGNLLVGAAGSSALCERFVEWVRGGMSGNSPYQGNEDGNGMIVTPDNVVIVFGEKGCWKVDSAFFAMGSGERFAMGAMAHGASAHAAIEAAIKLDIYSGGPVRTVTR